MGLFGKIKNILFEDDDEVGEMPVYTKEDVKEVQKAIEEENIQAPFDPNPINSTNDAHFNNVKRDIDMQFDDNDVIGEVEGAKEVIQSHSEPEETPFEPVKPKEEKKSPFLSFDEDEFERLNSYVNNNEAKQKNDNVREVSRENKTEVPSYNEARRANNNFSSTSAPVEKKENDPERYKISATPGRKPFKPSPVISPVYGILDKNYKKDEIVDKKDGMKREKIVKPIVHKVEDNEENVEVDVYEEKNTVTVDIDSVRKKAYGGLELLEKQATSDTLEKQKAEKPEVDVKVKEVVPEEPSVEEQLDDDKDFEVTNVIDVSEEKDNIEEKFPVKEEVKQKPKALDEMEKTNTLQILDDIEKELNSIKPISKEESPNEEDEMKEHLERSDTLENDLFNLIDSMYEQDEQGEEEEND